MARPKGTNKYGAVMSFSDRQFHRFISVLKEEKRRRNDFLFSFMYAYALRVSEASAFKLEYIDEDRGKVLIIASKKGKVREYDFNPEDTPKLWRKYRCWLKERTLLRGAEKNPHLFITRLSGSSKPMSKDAMQAEFKRVCEKAGIATSGWNGFSIHSLRHTVAKNALFAGENVVTIKKLLRHKSLETTKEYLERVCDRMAEAERRTIRRADQYL